MKSIANELTSSITPSKAGNAYREIMCGLKLQFVFLESMFFVDITDSQCSLNGSDYSCLTFEISLTTQ